MAQSQPDSHEGELGKTPIAHLLVYAIERQLTGLLSLAAPNQEPTKIRLERGIPVKVRVGDGFALFGEMLIEAGAIDRPTLDEALQAKGLLGDALMVAGRVDRGLLERIAAEQVLRRITRLFELGPTSRFRYEDGSSELVDWGGEPGCVDPLLVVWQGVRAHGSPSVATTIAALGEAHLPIHPSAPIARYGLNEDELLLVEHLAVTPSSVAELASFDLVPAAVLERLVYFLAIARALDLGTGSMPVGVAPILSGGRTSSQVVAKVALRPLAHRQGAAAPDMPGDGERAPILARKRIKTGSELTPVSSTRETPCSPLDPAPIASESMPDGSNSAELVPPLAEPRGGRSA